MTESWIVGDNASSGKDWPAVDLVSVAQGVGMPSRANCGACHFTGGGGDAVKHGDMDTSLKAPSFELDVHMDAEGLIAPAAEAGKPREVLVQAGRRE